MAKPSEINDWEARRAGIVGLGERSFHKSYYPQLRQNVERLERFHTVLDQTTDFVILVALPDGTVTDANAALGRLLGEPAANLIGRPFAELGLGDAQDVLDVLRREMSEGLWPETRCPGIRRWSNSRRRGVRTNRCGSIFRIASRWSTGGRSG